MNLDSSLNVELADPQKRENPIKVFKDWNKILSNKISVIMRKSNQKLRFPSHKL